MTRPTQTSLRGAMLWDEFSGLIDDADFPDSRPIPGDYSDSELEKMRLKMVRSLPEVLSDGWFQGAASYVYEGGPLFDDSRRVFVQDS